MTKYDSALYPGEYFLERRDKLDGKWELSSRDNDVDVMRTRFDYWKGQATAGQSFRLYAPNCSIVEDFTAPGEVTPAAVVVGPEVK